MRSSCSQRPSFFSCRAAGRVVRKSTATRLAAPIEAQAGDREILRQVVAYYHETLKESPEALRYLESRGLTHPEMIEHFKLGFANRTLGYRLPEKNRKAGAEMRGRLQTARHPARERARALQRLAW